VGTGAAERPRGPPRSGRPERFMRRGSPALAWRVTPDGNGACCSVRWLAVMGASQSPHHPGRRCPPSGLSQPSGTTRVGLFGHTGARPVGSTALQVQWQRSAWTAGWPLYTPGGERWAPTSGCTPVGIYSLLTHTHRQHPSGTEPGKPPSARSTTTAGSPYPIRCTLCRQRRTHPSTSLARSPPADAARTQERMSAARASPPQTGPLARLASRGHRTAPLGATLRGVHPEKQDAPPSSLPFLPAGCG
jgi:hypothetical protein